MADLPPLPPRKTDQSRPLPPRPVSAAAASPRADARPGKPDPRPMRVVYGAGAVAVASVIAVGLVQPDFTATADQQATTDPNLADQGQNQQVADAGNGNGNGRTDQSNNSGTTNTQVKHVTKYIHLKPGQTAPPGATVIQPGQPTPKVVTANNPGSAPTSPPNHNPKPTVAPPPVHQPPAPTPKPTAKPTPKPTTKTHQSGRP